MRPAIACPRLPGTRPSCLFSPSACLPFPLQAVSQGEKPLLAAKGLRVGDFNGKNLSTVGATNLRLNPMDLPQAQALKNWCVGRQWREFTMYNCNRTEGPAVNNMQCTARIVWWAHAPFTYAWLPVRKAWC